MVLSVCEAVDLSKVEALAADGRVSVRLLIDDQALANDVRTDTQWRAMPFTAIAAVSAWKGIAWRTCIIAA